MFPKPKPMKKRSVKTISCKRCGTEFERRTDLINRRNGDNYCTRECASLANGDKTRGKVLEKSRKGEYKKCVICEKKFYVRASRPNKENARCCSYECRGKWQATQPLPKGFVTDNSGEKNGRFKDGKRNGEHFTKIGVRKAVIKRDGNWCLLCGKPPSGLHLHRVIYGSHGGKYEADNCVQLCVDHHQLVHSSKKTWAPILLDYLEIAKIGLRELEPIDPPEHWYKWFVKHKIQPKLTT